jgi:hypothetical protein
MQDPPPKAMIEAGSARLSLTHGIRRISQTSSATSVAETLGRPASFGCALVALPLRYTVPEYFSGHAGAHACVLLSLW